MKSSQIQVHDARRKVEGKTVPAYRVKSVAKNGEILQTSEVLNTVQAVNKHILAMKRAWDTNFYMFTVHEKLVDHTKNQVFAKKKLASGKV